jgi:hypothetical protein
MRRTLVWPAVLPLAAAGVLVGHDLAYRLSGAGGAGLHDYLAHAPQVLVALSLPALLVALSGGRTRSPRPLAFAFVGVGGFAAMEHLERLGHGGLPWLATTPVFLLGLALQLPFALAAWWLARALLGVELPPVARPAPLPRLTFAVSSPAAAPVAAATPARPRPRGPPALL